MLCVVGFTPCWVDFTLCVVGLMPCWVEFMLCVVGFTPCWVEFMPCVVGFTPCWVEFMLCVVGLMPCWVEFMPCVVEFTPCWVEFMPCVMGFTPACAPSPELLGTAAVHAGLHWSELKARTVNSLHESKESTGTKSQALRLRERLGLIEDHCKVAGSARSYKAV